MQLNEELAAQKSQSNKSNNNVPTAEELVKKLQSKGTLRKDVDKVPTIAELAAKKKKEIKQ